MGFNSGFKGLKDATYKPGHS